MLIKDTATYSISVSEDVYTFTNKTGSPLDYDLYRQDAVKVLISQNTVAASSSATITFDGDGIYIVNVTSDETEIRYYLELQSNLLSVIDDFLSDCCSFVNPTYDCSCTDPVEVRCTQFASVQTLLLAYKNLVDTDMNNSGSGAYLTDAAEQYEYNIRTAYLNQFLQECIAGKSVQGTKALKYLTSIYYTLFLETELNSRDAEDQEFIENKFNADSIKDSMAKIGIDYNELKQLFDDNILVVIVSLNLSIEIDRSSITTYVFSSGNFPYVEGNPTGRTHIRINTAPSEGELDYNGNELGVDVALPFVIEESNIGNLSYITNNGNLSAYSVNFDFDSSNNNMGDWG